MTLSIKAHTAWKLGLRNIGRVALYRLGLRTGVHPVLRIQADITGEEFFKPPRFSSNLAESLPRASERWRQCALYFGWKSIPVDSREPDWHANLFLGTRVERTDRPWHKIPDFDPAVGDIKTIWEPSRFEWLLPMAQRAVHGQVEEVARMNLWLADWTRVNPAYLGPNWKCGQEASIRVIHLAIAARLLGQDNQPRPDLLRLVRAHVARIYPTISYAMGQDNNHGTSEAAGLFIGGHWCHAHGVEEALTWARAGRRLLENRVRRLIGADGSFSQYSVNYHRLMLDTLSIAELWRRWHGLEPFSQEFYARARAAASWLYAMVNPEIGDAPNLGANDGARILPLVDTDYRDYRPSVQLAMALFYNTRAYAPAGAYDDHLAWLGMSVSDTPAPEPGSVQFDEGGYALLRRGPWLALLRYPRFRFRPSHCDVLHVDLWYGEDNLLRDGGTYSYNAADDWLAYFPGTVAHNTIQFDGRDQMPRLGRFLWGAWPKADRIEPLDVRDDSVSFGAAYRDWKGARHSRRVRLDDRGMVVQDEIAGFSERAVLRWRLKPDEWELNQEGANSETRVVVTCGPYSLQIQADVPIVRAEIMQGWESRYYLKKTPLPVLEVEVQSAGTLITKVIRHKE